jgi:3-dehydroquinate synthetase/predicted NBD/HSP70 family sugar kinase
VQVTASRRPPPLPVELRDGVDGAPLAGRAGAGPPVVVFDIGGTWFRSGIVSSEGELVDVSRSPAISYVSCPTTSVAELQRRLADYIATEALRLRATAPGRIDLACVSMGAALNGHTGVVLNSGPLWGPSCRPVDLLALLRARVPEIRWSIVNDVSAALLAEVASARELPPRLTLVTVSTGIACRTYDSRTGAIPLDRVHGLQGEIGHLPVRFVFRGRPLEFRCACGGHSHLNAYASGRGIAEVLAATSPTEDSARARAQPVESWSDAVMRGDADAIEVLDAVTLPLAQVLLGLFTLDPESERVLLTGGVVERLGRRYVGSLVGNLERLGLYRITDEDATFFRRRLGIASAGGDAGLVGAAIHARDHARQDASSAPAAMRWHVRAAKTVEYEVLERDDVLGQPGNDMIGESPTRGRVRRLVVVDAMVHELYGGAIRAYFDSRGIGYELLRLAVSEDLKGADLALRIVRELDRFGLARRREPLIAFGGGVLMDVVGFAASLYRRGVPYVRVPTTLVGIIDAGVGIKTAVNYRYGKSRLGTYHPPVRVLLDRTFLRTLDSRHVRNGVAEMAKIAIVKDRTLFELLEASGPSFVRTKFQQTPEALVAIRRAVTGMLDELRANLWETKLERLVDFGHSFTAPIEMRATPRVLHGEAVAIDMAFSTVLAAERGMLSEPDCDRILRLLERLRLPLSHELVTAPGFVSALEETTRHRDGRQRLPLPTGIGSGTFVNDVEPPEIERAVARLGEVTHSFDLAEASSGAPSTVRP